jgi:hypothetical protein
MKLHHGLTSLIAILIALRAAQVPAALIINEVDSDTVNTPSTDFAEFLELYETTGTSVPLDGYVLVFYNGNGNVVYRAEDLDGRFTRSNGFFVAGAVAGADYAIPGNTIQNGVDAIALYQGNAVDFPNGTAPTTTNLIDAVVYRTGADMDGVGLAAALGITGPVVDEFGRDGMAATGAIDSIGRLPNAAGAPRDTTSWTFMTPTPGLPNVAIPEPACC